MSQATREDFATVIVYGKCDSPGGHPATDSKCVSAEPRLPMQLMTPGLSFQRAIFQTAQNVSP